VVQEAAPRRKARNAVLTRFIDLPPFLFDGMSQAKVAGRMLSGLAASHLSSLPRSRFSPKGPKRRNLSEAARLPGMANGTDMQGRPFILAMGSLILASSLALVEAGGTLYSLGNSDIVIHYRI
jgi:hypothetical protein